MNARELRGSKFSIGKVPVGKTRFAALAAAAVFAVAGVAAMAQPVGVSGHGPHGGVEIGHLLAALKGQLNLNTSQQLMWDNAVAQTTAARDAGRANMQQVHAALTAELAKAEPDLAAVAAASDSAQASNQTLRHGVRDQWLKIYATFTPDQKAVVRDALSKRLARMESWHAKMRERMQGGS
jgi:Spy/CpxP family protein refolding chaperone